MQNHYRWLTWVSVVLLFTTVMSNPVWAIVGPKEPPGPAADNPPPSGGNFPAVGAVYPSSGALGSGTLISPMHVLTAAHNFYDGDMQDAKSGKIKFQFRADPKNPNDPSDDIIFDPSKPADDPMNMMAAYKEFEFEKVIIHPRFNPRKFGSNDIAIVKLKDMVPGTGDPNAMGMGINPLPLFMNMDGTDKMEMGMSDHVGWGRTNNGTRDVKRDGDNTVDGRAMGPMETEPNSLLKYDFDAPGMGVPPMEAGTGSGDSGGPAIIGGAVAGSLVGAGPVHRFPGGGNAAVHGAMITYTRTQAYKERFINPTLNNVPAVMSDTGNGVNVVSQSYIPAMLPNGDPNPNAHLGMNTLSVVEEVDRRRGPFEIDIMVPNIPMGGEAMIALDKCVVNNSLRRWTDFHIEVGTIKLNPDPDKTNFIFTVSNETDLLFIKDNPPAMDMSGHFPNKMQDDPVDPDSMWFFGRMGPLQTAKFWLGLNVPDMIDGMMDGMASFTVRQYASVPEPSSLLAALLAVGMLATSRRPARR